MNYPRILQDGQLVFIKNELTNNKQVLCEVIGFISKSDVYYVQQLPDYPRGIINGKIYTAGIDDLSTIKEESKSV
jgi:hypothetical protein